MARFHLRETPPISPLLFEYGRDFPAFIERYAYAEAMPAAAWPPLVQLVLRFALAVPFWRSGILKWDGFLQLSDTAVTLFTDEFMLHLPGGPYPFPVPTVMAFLSGCGEITFPILLVLGLGTRFAAVGLLGMTAIVELTVPDGWPIHLTWAAMALAIAAYGAGRLSLDDVIGRLLRSSLPPQRASARA